MQAFLLNFFKLCKLTLFFGKKKINICKKLIEIKAILVYNKNVYLCPAVFFDAELFGKSQ